MPKLKGQAIKLKYNKPRLKTLVNWTLSSLKKCAKAGYKAATSPNGINCQAKVIL